MKRAPAILVVVLAGCVRAGFGLAGDGGPLVDGPRPGDASPLTDADGLVPDAPAGPAYYISPTGDDSADGSRAAPWRSWGKVVARLQPGDTLIALDGSYTDSSSGRLWIDCQSGADACDGGPCPSGTAASPITLRAEHERRAHITALEHASLRMDGCSHWVIHGLQLSQDDSGTDGELQLARVLNCDYIALRRLLVHRTNRSRNNHALIVSGCTNSLVEECEVYDFHRYGLYVNGGSDITLRRNYVNSRDRADITGGYASSDPTTGDVGIQVGGGQRIIVENNLVERAWYGIQVQPEVYPAPVAGAGDDVRLLGNVVRLVKQRAYHFDSDCQSQSPCNSSTDTVSNLEVRDCVALDSARHGFTANGVEGAKLINLTSQGALHDDYHFDLAPENSALQSAVALTNCLDFGGGDNGFLLADQSSWSVDHCNSHGNTTNLDLADPHVTASSTIDPQMGGCLIYVPAGSPMKGAGAGGADIGANVVLAYEDGALTGKRLWDQSSGAFVGCGAVVSGVNDSGTGEVCGTVQQRLHVGSGGCTVP